MPSLAGSKTHDNLKHAFAGESQANRRYLYFARQADVGLSRFADDRSARPGHRKRVVRRHEQGRGAAQGHDPCRTLIGGVATDEDAEGVAAGPEDRGGRARNVHRLVDRGMPLAVHANDLTMRHDRG